ncbi:hypothetical protein [Rachiplusia nu nucleopolyhedrovirus]|uniref:Uncharacterized protein n=1 Tax=Rachiplusia nu nucleopolyhedrovirus TaxID=2605775 RepID=A0AAE6IRB1_9ABAC|nr:hypothetical protein QKQ55_gp027 [Rachiplusia nu nucleopolyhedrovirus]QEI03589.1 hypothetical protein [Rachiplusia nu nucleopolyhedrovirus]
MIDIDQLVKITIKDWKSSGIHGVVIEDYDEFEAALIVLPGKGKIYYNGLKLTARIIRIDKLFVDLVAIE